MKHLLLFFLVSSIGSANAQKIDSIYVNLYTDSLKKGTQNYINIDGRLAEGRYLPLDSSDVIFSSSAGKFIGNCLWIDSDFKEEKVNIRVVLRSDRNVFKQFDMYVKKKPDNEQLKTAEEIINEARNGRKSRPKSN